MDRQIVYIGQIPQDTDQLQQNKNTMIGLGYALAAILGSTTSVDGLACTPNSPAAMNVLVAPGSIYSLQNVDATAYGSLPSDTSHQIVKQGISAATLTLSCPAPATTGQSVVYLVQAAYQDTDGGSVVLPYYNASNPAIAWSGPNNSGVSQNTVRQGVCTISVKAGVAATTGTQTTPAPDAGFTGLYAITVANGQTSIVSGNIVQLATAPFVGTKLPNVLQAIQQDTPNYAEDTSGTANTITVILSPIPSGLTKGMPLRVKVANANTGAVVINVNGLGNVSVVTPNGSALSAGALSANGIYSFVYDQNGSRWQVQGITTPTAASNGYFFGGTTGGSANAQTLGSVTPSGYTKSQGNAVAFTAGFTNTGAATLNINSTGATAVKVDTGSGLAALTGGEIVAGGNYVVYCDGTQYTLIDPSTLAFLNSPALTGTPTAPTAAAGSSNSQIANTQFVQNAVTAVSPTQSSFKNLVASWGSTSTLTITADEIVVEDSSGKVAKASGVSLTVNTATTGANGCDVAFSGFSANSWAYGYVIQKPDGTTAGLLSASSSAPTLPSGYTLKSGPITVVLLDSSKNLVGFKQFGRDWQYVVGNNLASAVTIASGALGNASTPTWTAQSVTGIVPTAIAAKIRLYLSDASGSNLGIAAPNSSYGGASSLTNPPPLMVSASAVCCTGTEFLLESTSVYYAGGSSNALFCQGFTLNI